MHVNLARAAHAQGEIFIKLPFQSCEQYHAAVHVAVRFCGSCALHHGLFSVLVPLMVLRIRMMYHPHRHQGWRLDIDTCNPYIHSASSSSALVAG